MRVLLPLHPLRRLKKEKTLTPTFLPKKGEGVKMPILLKESYHHDAGAPGRLAAILDLQHRGEYLYAVRGKAGFYAYDIANIDNKGLSERIISSPVSPLGQRLGFDTKNCVAIASPATVAVDPARSRLSDDPAEAASGNHRPAATLAPEPGAAYSPAVRLPLHRRRGGGSHPHQRRDAARRRPAE